MCFFFQKVAFLLEFIMNKYIIINTRQKSA